MTTARPPQAPAVVGLRATAAHGRLRTPSGLAAVLGVVALLLVLAGLAAGAQGWSFAWADEAPLITAIRAPRTLGALLAGALLGLSGG